MGSELHNLTPPPGARKRRKRVGRGLGSGLAQTAGRGSKGQKKRSTVRRAFEGGQNPIHRRVPKRGFVNIHRIEYFGVNLSRIDAAFGEGEEITPDALHAKGLVPKRAERIKLLADGDVTKKLRVSLHRVSVAARAKVEAAGGQVELLEAAGAAEAASEG